MSDETTEATTEVEETVEPAEAEAEGEAYQDPVEVGETGVLEGGGLVEGEGTTVGVSDDLAALNERLGYPITGEGKDAESEVEESADDDSEVPTEANTVAEIKTYLDAQGTEYSSSATKAELLELV